LVEISAASSADIIFSIGSAIYKPGMSSWRETELSGAFSIFLLLKLVSPLKTP
jgi:hypothetical protein